MLKPIRTKHFSQAKKVVPVNYVTFESSYSVGYLDLKSGGRGFHRGSSPAAGPDDGSTSPPPRPHTALASSHTEKNKRCRYITTYLFNPM